MQPGFTSRRPRKTPQPGVLAGPTPKISRKLSRSASGWICGWANRAFGSEPKYKGILFYSIEQRFDPQPVPAEKQTVLLSIPDGKGKNPVELFCHFHAIFHISAKNHLGITGGFKAVAQAAQIPFQFLRIVDLPVVDDSIFPVSPSAQHWAVPRRTDPGWTAGCGKIPHGGADIPRLVPSPVGDGRPHLYQDLRPVPGIRKKITMKTGKTGNSTHKHTPQPKIEGAVWFGPAPVSIDSVSAVLMLCKESRGYAKSGEKRAEDNRNAQPKGWAF